MISVVWSGDLLHIFLASDEISRQHGKLVTIPILIYPRFVEHSFAGLWPVQKFPYFHFKDYRYQ